jgi:phosphomannomutase
MTIGSYTFSKNILRANDIRGTYGIDLTETDARAIGAAFGTLLARRTDAGEGTRKVAIAYDGRLSSPMLEAALIEGLTGTGTDVVRLGLGPTPMLYFAMFRENYGGGICITGSHNPAHMNGMKMMLGRSTLHGAGITELAEIAASGAYACGSGNVESNDISGTYIDTLAAAFLPGRDLSVGWDPGNGAIDGTFPNHHPDPTVPRNLEQLVATLKAEDLEVGVAFDGDGDRLGVVNCDGRILWGDQLLGILAEDLLASRPGATIVADVKASDRLFQHIASLGGHPVMWKTGHAFIKSKMTETKALLAGEMSGHIFFADKYYGYDDGVYAAIRFLSILAKGPRSLGQRMDDLPRTSATPELRFHCPDERKFLVIEELRAHPTWTEGSLSDIDGLRITNRDGWWLLRASNTQPVLVGRCEGHDEASLERLKGELQTALSSVGVAPTLVD